MPTLNLSLDTFRNPKIIRLRAAHGSDAVLGLIALWMYAGAEFRTDGRFVGFTSQMLAGVAGCAPEHIDMMIELGLLDAGDDGIIAVHDWQSHNGHLQKYHEAAKTASKKRWEKSKQNADEYADSMRMTCEPHAIRNANRNADGNASYSNSISKDNDTTTTTTLRDKRASQADKPYSRRLDPATQLVYVYKRLKGYAVTDRRWDVHFSRARKTTGEIVTMFGLQADVPVREQAPDFMRAVRAMRGVASALTSRGLSYTLETLAKHALDYDHAPAAFMASTGQSGRSGAIVAAAGVRAREGKYADIGKH